MEKAYWTICLLNHLQGTFFAADIALQSGWCNWWNQPNCEIRYFCSWFSSPNDFSPDTPEWSLIANGESFHKVNSLCSVHIRFNELTRHKVELVKLFSSKGFASFYAWKPWRSAYGGRGESHQVAFSSWLFQISSNFQIASFSSPC